MPGLVGMSTTSSESVASNNLPAAGVRLACGCSALKSRETSLAGNPWMSGQLPVPLRSSVQVTGSPTPTVRGTTLEVSVNWPTAPAKSAGAPSGSGLTVRESALLVTVCCTTSGAAKGFNRKPPVLMLSTISWLAAGIW